MRHSNSNRNASVPPTTCSRLLLATGLALILGNSGVASAASAVDEIAGARKVCLEGPAAAVARAERLAGDAAITAAGVLPNPQASVQHQRALVGSGERETIAGLSVTLGLGGRRFLLQDAAVARRDQAQAVAHATLFDAALAFREAYIAAVLDAARVGALEEQQRALEAFATTIDVLAKGGEQAGYARKRHEAQVLLHRRQLTAMKAQAAASLATIAVWLSEEATLATPALGDLAGGQRNGNATTTTHPRIQELIAAERASRMEVRAAHRNWVPDVTVFAGYRVLAEAGAPTARGISASISIPITLFDHGQGDAALAEANRARAQASADTLRRGYDAQIKASTDSLAVLEASIGDADRAVADAISLRTSAVKLYAAGESTIVEVLDAFRAAEEAQLSRIDVAEQIARARLLRMRAAGTQFDASLDEACGGAPKGTSK